MYGFVYIIENLINGHYYIGKTTEANLTFEPYLAGIIRKCGTQNFRQIMIAEAGSKTDLDTLEIEMIFLCKAVADARYCRMIRDHDANRRHADKLILQWRTMDAEQKIQIVQEIRDKNHGIIKSPEYRAKMRLAKTGVSHWTSESLERMTKKRLDQIVNGIAVPPKGNRGNRSFRHSKATKDAIKATIAKTRARVAQERARYVTDAGLIAMREKFSEHYTQEMRQQHAKLIKAGQARRLADYEMKGVEPPKFHWYHNPYDPTQRASFKTDTPIPRGWVPGMGRRKRRIDVARVTQLIDDGWRDADIAREIGCAPSGVWQIRRDLDD